MKRMKETKTPDLDMILLRAGYPVADRPAIRALQRHRMYQTRCRICRKAAVAFQAIAVWFDERSGEFGTGKLQTS